VAVWILKTEPAECSLDDIRDVPGAVMRWDGIRNYQARNNLRAMRSGDICLVYHSSVREAGIVGSAELVREAYPDPAQFDEASPYVDATAKVEAPRWFAVDIRYTGRFAEPLSAQRMRVEPALSGLALLRQGRLSVSPVSDAQWLVLRTMLGASSP
jgi:predicted RNA-binding protein with PUA-like domain